MNPFCPSFRVVRTERDIRDNIISSSIVSDSLTYPEAMGLIERIQEEREHQPTQQYTLNDIDAINGILHLHTELVKITYAIKP